jgi:hypothetical protein
MVVRDIYLSFELSFISLLLSGPFVNLNGNDIVPSRWIISREIARQANEIRQRLGVKLRNAAIQGCLAISPDLWSDKFKQNSYLGLTAHCVDDYHVLRSIDLSCEPYNEINKRANSVQKVGNNIESNFFLFVYLLFLV